MIRDAWLILKHELLVTAREPFWIFFGLFQPVVYLLLFAPFLSGIADAPGFPSENSIQFFAPGLLMMNALFQAGFAGFGLIEKLETGFLERLRVTPIDRLALVLGFVLVSTITVLVQSVLLVLAALPFGLHISLVGALLLLVLLVLVAITMGSISYALALIVKDPGILAGVTNFFILPVLLLSGIMLPIAFGPPLLQWVAAVNPLYYASDAARALLEGRLGDGSIPIAFASFVVLAALTLLWFNRTTREAVA